MNDPIPDVEVSLGAAMRITLGCVTGTLDACVADGLSPATLARAADDAADELREWATQAIRNDRMAQYHRLLRLRGRA